MLLQACLRLEKIPINLELGKEYEFEKDEHRIYQIGVPMDLRLNNWDFVCRIIIKEYTIGNNKTKGIFIPVKMFSEEERETITKCFVSNEEVQKILEIK